MTKPFVCLLSLIFFLLLCSVAFCQEFSADLVNLKGESPRNVGKLYVGTDKARFEAQDAEAHGGVVLMNFTTHVTDVLIPERQMYLEMMQEQTRRQQPFAFFRPTDPDNACGEWLKMVAKPGSTCHRVGPDLLDGRATTKYVGTSQDGETGTVWVDSKLRFALKWQDKNGTVELQNIKEGSQPGSLFEIPSGYQKMDMGNMMRNTPQQ
jgi:hypothetical protein